MTDLREAFGAFFVATVFAFVLGVGIGATLPREIPERERVAAEAKYQEAREQARDYYARYLAECWKDIDESDEFTAECYRSLDFCRSEYDVLVDAVEEAGGVVERDAR